MRRVVRPVWIALAGTTVPPDATERCRRSFEHIRRFFLTQVGRTFKVEKLEIIPTHHTIEYFQRYHAKYAKWFKDLLRRDYEEGKAYISTLPPHLREELNIAKALDQLDEIYHPEGKKADHLFAYNVMAFFNEVVKVTREQIWVIFVPGFLRIRFNEVTAAATVPWSGPDNPYCIISTSYLGKEFSDESCINYVSQMLEDQSWGSGGGTEGVIAHELGHAFSLLDCPPAPDDDIVNSDSWDWLMGLGPWEFPNCSLHPNERAILRNHYFFH